MTRALANAIKSVVTERKPDSLVYKLGVVAGSPEFGLKTCVEALKLQERTILALGSREEILSLLGDGPPLLAVRNVELRHALEERELSAAACALRERAQR